MITWKDIYDVLSAVVPLYVAMILAYGSVRWWKIFTPEQCSGINRFVAVFAVPLLSFHFISSNNIYKMDYMFLAADSLQKVVILLALFLWHNLFRRSNLDWTITLFSLSSLPNTLVMGIPLLTAMYGEYSGNLMVQIVVLQCVIWYTLMLFLFEYRGAKTLITEQFPADIAGAITSFQVDSDVISLNGREPLQADAEIGKDGKVHVVVRKSSSSAARSMVSYNKSTTSFTPRTSNLTGVEIYSLQSSREPTPRASSFNQNDFYAMFSNKLTSPKASGGGNDEEMGVKSGKHKGSASKSGELKMNGGANSSSSSYPPPNPTMSDPSSKKKDLHMFVWSSTSASPVSEANLRNAVHRAAASNNFGTLNQGIPTPKASANASPMRKEGANGEPAAEDGGKSPAAGKFPTNKSPYIAEKKGAEAAAAGGEQPAESNNSQMPPASVMTRLILIMVWRKLIRNPNTYSSLIGLIWSLISFRWNVEMPAIIKGSIEILSNAGLGMAMFSLGLFMALQPNIIACGKKLAAFAMLVRFLTGPAVMAATSIVVGLRGTLLHAAIVQAALPQGIVPFVFAKEYNCHPNILSTGVIFGMLVALPITILYYILLGV